jgi:hypothetical protein
LTEDWENKDKLDDTPDDKRKSEDCRTNIVQEDSKVPLKLAKLRFLVCCPYEI